MTDKTWPEIFTMLLGACTLAFGLEAGSWWIAHQFAWWTFALVMGVGFVGWLAVKSFAREIRKTWRKR